MNAKTRFLIDVKYLEHRKQFPMRGLGITEFLAGAEAMEEIMRKKLTELTKKGEQTCEALGNALMREAKLVAALDQALRQWEMYVTEAAQDDLEKIEHAEAGELRSCKRVLAEHHAAKGVDVDIKANVTGESCPKCGSKDFAVARDMTATRHCIKCHATWLPGAKGEG